MTRIFGIIFGGLDPIIEKSKTCPEPWSKDLKWNRGGNHGTEKVNAA